MSFTIYRCSTCSWVFSNYVANVLASGKITSLDVKTEGETKSATVTFGKLMPHFPEAPAPLPKLDRASYHRINS